MDLVVPVERHPKPGETVIGGDLQRFPGGKGANQAVAAARLGARVRMVGRVGLDEHGAQLLRSLENEGVDIMGVQKVGTPTGVALIGVDVRGQNAIIVAPGANARLGPDDLNPERFAGAGVVVLQLETPLETVQRAAELGRAAGAVVLLNAAPAQELPAELLAATDVLVVNEFEAAQVAGAAEPTGPEEALALARELAQRVPVVVVTLGSRGLVWAGAEGEGHLPAFEVEAVDTTAAGDAFVGGLAAALAAGNPLEEALRFGSAAGALAATGLGAQTSLPTLREVGRLLAGERVESRGSLMDAETFEVEKRSLQIARLLEAIGYPDAWVSDRSWLRDFVNEVTSQEELVSRVRHAYGVSLRPEDLEKPLWILVDELERRPLA
jgi:ribokinase